MLKSNNVNFRLDPKNVCPQHLEVHKKNGFVLNIAISIVFIGIFLWSHVSEINLNE